MILDVLTDLQAAIAPAGWPVSIDPANPPSSPGVTVLVTDEEWVPTLGACSGPVEVTVSVAVIAGGVERGQVRELREAVPLIADRVPRYWQQVSLRPAPRDDGRPCYLLELTRET